MLDPHLRGLLVGLFLGVGVGGAVAVQPIYGWMTTVAVLTVLAAIAWAEHVYFHRKPGVPA